MRDFQMFQEIKRTELFTKVVRPLLPDVTLALLVVSDWLILTALLQMIVTEWWYTSFQVNYVPEWWNLLILGGLLVLATVLRVWWSSRARLLTDRWLFGSFLAALLICAGVVAGYTQYRAYYSQLQQHPKVQHVSPIVGIPGERVEILGRNFGHPHEPGTVHLGEVELLIVSWNDERVVVEVPVEKTIKSTTILRIITENQKELVIENQDYENF